MLLSIIGNAMKILGLTGSIGMGKSTVSKMFAAEGVPVWDADASVHDIYATDKTMRAHIALHHVHCLRPDGVNRKMLGGIIFNNETAHTNLLAVLNPIIQKRLNSFLTENHSKNLVVLDVPLLFETGIDKRCDITVVVSAGEKEQKIRVMARPGMTEELFQQFMSRQMSDKEKRGLADYLIDTNTPIEETREAVNRLISSLVALV